MVLYYAFLSIPCSVLLAIRSCYKLWPRCRQPILCHCGPGLRLPALALVSKAVSKLVSEQCVLYVVRHVLTTRGDVRCVLWPPHGAVDEGVRGSVQRTEPTVRLSAGSGGSNHCSGPQFKALGSVPQSRPLLGSEN